MIELLAAALDGWALVRAGDSLWLVRPPYRSRDRDRLTDSQVERALVEEDFLPDRRPFAGWGELCRYLQDSVLRRASPEQLEAARQAASRLLARADHEMARQHLVQIRQTLSKGGSPGVETALIALLRADSVQGDPELVKEVGDLLSLAQRARYQVHSTNRPQRTWIVADEVGVEREAETIRERRSLLVAWCAQALEAPGRLPET